MHTGMVSLIVREICSDGLSLTCEFEDKLVEKLIRTIFYTEMDGYNYSDFFLSHYKKIVLKFLEHKPN